MKAGLRLEQGLNEAAFAAFGRVLCMIAYVLKDWAVLAQPLDRK
jgi:hypothetical protein